MEGGVFAESQESAPAGAAVARGDTADCAVGRFLGRKGDGEPGAKTLWLGLRDIAVFVDGMQATRQGE
jgi:hypothetical protein